VAHRRSELSLLLGCLLYGCTVAPEKPAAPKLTSEETMALTMHVTDCETKAANRYDDGNSTISSLAHQIMMICQPEIIKLRLAFHIPLDDPEFDLHEFKHAVDAVERERKSRASR
jgi:hypothetical protein